MTFVRSRSPNRMNRVTRFLLFLLLPVIATSAAQASASQNIEKFFSDFTAEWMRGNPSGAASTRYFIGEEQNRFERRLTPETDAYRRSRIKLARQGLAELRKFDRARLTETQRVSAELMEWQLNTIVREEPHLDYAFPLNQFNGANVNLIETMTVPHNVSSARDAENYIAALGQVGMRMEEAISEARRLAGKNMIPPRFILDSTLRQMQQFIATSAAQNPFVTTFEQRMSAVAAIPE